MRNRIIFLAVLLLLLANTVYASECSQKESMIQSLERSLVAKDRAIQEAIAYNKRLSVQNHSEKVSQEERKMLQQALAQTKEELERTKKALKNNGKTVTVYKDKAPVIQEKIVEKIVYRDNHSISKTIEPKIIYKDKIVYRDKIIANKSCKPTIIYKDKVIEKIVYKDKIVEKVVFKEKPIKKVDTVAIKMLKVPAIKPKAPSKKSNPSEQKQRKLDKLALEYERMVSATNMPLAVKTTPRSKKGSPGVYRFASNAGIYNAINGTKIDMWEQGRSFTSGTASNGWVKITGYFVNRVWRAADEEMWVKEGDVVRR